MKTLVLKIITRKDLGKIWVVVLIGHAAWEICFNQSEALARSG